MSNDLDEKYLTHINETNLKKEWEDKCDRECEYGDYIENRTHVFDYFWDYTEFYDGYKRQALEEFYRYYSGKLFRYEEEHFQSLKNSICQFYTYLKTYKSSDKNISIYNYGSTDFWFGEKYIRLQIQYHYEKCSSKVFTLILNGDELSVMDGKYFSDYHYPEKEFFMNEVRPAMYEFLIIFPKYYDTFKAFNEIKYPDILRKIWKYKELETTLKAKEYDYSVNDKENILTVFGDVFQIEYNLVLKDAVVIVPDAERKYCNIDNIPIEYKSKRIADIISILLQEDSANGNG